MAFGLDPSIILSGMPNQLPVPTVNDTVETLARLGQYKAQQRQQEAQLADLVQKRQREQTLRDIYRTNAGNLEGIAPALMQGGEGDAAMDWMKGRSDIASRKAAADKLTSGLYELGLQRLRGRLSVVKTPEEYAQIVAQIPPEELAQLGLSGQYNPAEVAGFIAGGKAPGRVLSPVEQEAMSARAVLDLSKADVNKRGPGAADPDKRKNLQLKNQKLEQELGGAGGPAAGTETEKDKNLRLRNEKLAKDMADASGPPKPNKLTKLKGYDLDPEYEVTPKDAAELRKAQDTTATMTETIDQMMALYQQYGNTVLPSAVRARMGSLATDLKLAAKGPEMYALGVIAGPDMGLLNSVISDPTQKEATIADFVSGGGDASETMERFKVFREQAGKKLHNKLLYRGYRPEQKEKGAGTKGAAVSLNPGEVLMVDPKGKRHAVAEKDVADAESHKWKRAKTGDINL